MRDIVSVCNGGTIITKVMFHAYLSYVQAKAYLGQLVESGLVEHDSLQRKYFTTSKGIEYLATADRMAQMLALDIRSALPKENLVSC